MHAAELPRNEARRLSALYEHDVLDSPREEVFDEIAELAALLCNAPIALITLVDESRQWFKARTGIAATETARSVSFCAHAILQPDLFVVPDTLKDERFFDNPLVTGPPRIRFYAGAPLVTDDGCGLGTLCIIDHYPRTLTAEQKKTLAVLRTHVMKLLELRRTTHHLAIANRELESFSYTVSHDLRAPLRAITGYTKVLLTDHREELSDDFHYLAEKVASAAERMDQLTADLIKFSKLLRQSLDFFRVDLSCVAGAIVTDLHNAEPGRFVTVTIQPDLIAMGDPGTLRILFENLLQNAWKFTSTVEQPEIEIGSTWTDGSQEFYVRDNGVGFDMAYVEKLFQPFQRLHSSSQFPGTGIGLATVRRIVERHGGSVRAESVLGYGTTIRFTLQHRMPEGGEKHPPTMM